MLSSRDWVYWASLFGPLFAYNLTLKLTRMASVGEPHNASAVLSLLHSDLLFHAGLALFWLGALAIARRARFVGTAVLFLMSFTCLVDVIVATGAHRYFEKMGSALDFGIVAVAAREYEDVKPVMASETPWLAFALAIGYTCLGPPLIAWTTSLTGLVSAKKGHWPASLRWGIGACLVGALGLVLSANVSPTPVSKSFARDPMTNLVVTAMPRRIPEAEGTMVIPSAAGARLRPRESISPRNLVLVILESTGAEVATPYAGRFAVTPFLGEVAERSLMVSRAYTTIPHTSKALVSIVCGVNPLPARALVETLPGRIPSTCLPELLEQQGYRTVFFEPATQAFENRRGAIENFGYQDFFPGESMDPEGFERANYFGFEDAVMLEPTRRWLLSLDGHTAFFATYMTNTAHHDYLAPRRRYGFEQLVDDDEHNRYLNAVRYQDFFLRDLYLLYEELGLIDKTVFVIVGDHGEAFGEHIKKKHDDVLYEEVARVPFLVLGSGLPPTRLEGPASLLDVLPTGADLAGFDLVGSYFPGSSILNLPENRVLWLSCFDDWRCLGRVEGYEKYIYFFDDQPDEIYDLSRDALERNDLAALRAEIVRQRRAEVLRWRSAMRALYGFQPPSRHRP